MTDALDTLRPEVREAVVAIDGGNGVFVNSDDGIGSEKWKAVRAELLRLAEDAAMFAHAVSLGQRYKQRAETAEAELAALKARIADSPIASLVYGQGDLLAAISAENPDDWAGKRVRLVVEE